MQQVDDPPYLTVGTEVSAKYKGAFCEAKVRKVDRNIKCKVAYKLGLGSGTVSDDQIRGDQLRVGASVEVRHPDRKDYVDATITKIVDSSQYTVVFDDGDITTLRRSALCLKSGRHFNESETLDQLPLTHPEHFGNPVIGGRRGGRRSRHMPEDNNSSDDDEDNAALIGLGGGAGGSGSGAGGAGGSGKRQAAPEKEEHIGKVVCVENTDTKKKNAARDGRENWFPALVVAPTAQDAVRIRVKDEYLVRSFKDGRYYTVPKKEATEFRRDKHTQARQQPPSDAVQAALDYLSADALPAHWDRDVLFALAADRSSDTEASASDSDTSDDEPREEKDHFVAQLYKYMDDRGTPLNKGPSICNRDVDLYRLFRAVQKLNGYNKVTGQSQWKQIAVRLGYAPVTQSVQNLVKQAYKKFLLPFEEFDRKLGCTMVAHPRANRIKGRSLLRANSVASPKPDRDCKASQVVVAASAAAAGSVSAAAAAAATTAAAAVEPESSESTTASSVESGPETSRAKRKLSTGSAASANRLRPAAPLPAQQQQSALDSDDEEMPVPLATIALAVKLEETARQRDAKRLREAKEAKDSKDLLKDIKVEKVDADVATIKTETKPTVVKEEPSATHRSPSGGNGPPNAAGSSGRKEKIPKRPPPPTPPACASSAANSGGNDDTVRKPSQVATKKRRSEADAEKSTAAAATATTTTSSTSSTASALATSAAAAAAVAAAADPNDFPIEVGDKLKVFYHEQKTTYEAKVIEVSVQLGTAHYLVHYTGWNTRYDEWVPKERIAENLTNNRTNKKAKTGGAPSLSKDKFMAAAAAAGSSASAAASQLASSHLSTPASAATSSAASSSAPTTSTSKALFKRGRGSSRGESQPPRSTTPSSVASNSSRTKSPATPAAAHHQRRTTRGQPSSSSSVRRRTSNNTDMSSLPTDDDTDTDSDEPVKKPSSSTSATATVITTAATTSSTSAGRKPGPIPRGQSLPAASTASTTVTSATTAIAAQATVTAAVVAKSLAAASVGDQAKSSSGSSVVSGGGTKSNSVASSEEESMTGSVAAHSSTTTTTTTTTTTGRTNPATTTTATAVATSSTSSSKGGRDFDLNQIRSELKGFKELKSPSAEDELNDDDVDNNDDDDDNDNNEDIDDDEELDDEQDDDREERDDDEDDATTTGDDTADDAALRRRKTKPAFADFGSSTSHSNSTTVSDDPRTKPTVSSDSADSEASDSFGDDDSQFSDKTTTLANLSEKLQEKFKAGKLQTDVFKRATAAAAAAAATTTTGAAAQTAATVVTTAATAAPTATVSVVPAETTLDKVATLKPSSIEKIIKSTLAEKSKVPPEKSASLKPQITSDRSPAKVSATVKSVEPEITSPATPVGVTTAATKSPTKSVKARTIGEKGMFAERQKAAAAIAEKFPHRELFGAAGTTPSRSDGVASTSSSNITPKKTANASPPSSLRDEGDIYEFKEPEPFEFEAVKKISPETDKKAKKKSFAEKLNTSPLSSTAAPVAAKKAKKSPAKEPEKPPKAAVAASLRPLDVEMDMQSPPMAPLASPPMLFGSSGKPESIFDSLRKSPSFNLAAHAAANERDEMLASTSADAAAFDTTPAPTRIVSAPAAAPAKLGSFISSFVETTSPTKPSTTSAALSVPITADVAAISSSTSSAIGLATMADMLKVFVPGPNSDSDTETDASVQLATAKKILLADEVYEAPPKPDKPCSIADKVLKALNQQKCDQLAAAAAAAAATATTATSTTTTTVAAAATKTTAIVPGSAVPVSTAASTALTVATDSAKPRNELHAMLRAADMGAANKPILNSPDNSKFIAVDEAKNQDLSDTIKKLRGVVQPTVGEAELFADSDDEDSTGSERLVIEDVVVAVAAEASPLPTGDRKTGSRESSRSGFERVESPVQLAKKAGAANAKEMRKSSEPKETKKAAARKAAAEAKKDVHVPTAPESQTTGRTNPDIIIVKPAVNPTITIDAANVKAPLAAPPNIATTLKLVPSIADLNQLAPRVFASIVPLPEPIKPQVQDAHALSVLRAESPLATPLTLAAAATDAEEDADEDDDEDDDDDDDDDANGFGNSKLVIVTKDEEEDEEDDDDDDEENDQDTGVIAEGRLGVITDAPAASSTEFDRCASIGSGSVTNPPAASPARYSGTASAITGSAMDQQQQQQQQQQQSQQPNESLSLLMCEETIPGSPTPPTCPKDPGTVRNEVNTEDDDDDDDEDDDEGGDDSKRMAYDPTSSAPATNSTSSTAVKSLTATSSSSHPSQPPPSSSTTTKTTTVDASGSIVAQHAHPTGANIKPEPMDLEPCTAPPPPITVKTEPNTEAASTVRPMNMPTSAASASSSSTTTVVVAVSASVITTQSSVSGVAAAAQSEPPTTTTTASATAAVSTVTAVMVPLPMAASQRRDSFSNDDSDDVRKNVDNGSFAENRKRRRSKKASECETSTAATIASSASATKRRKNTSRRNTVTGSESEDNTGEYVAQKSAMSSQRSGPTKPCQYNFLVQLDPALNSHQRISIIHKKIQDLRKTYNHLKGELASIDRRRKKLRRRDRETKKLKQRLIDGIAANG